MYSAATGANGPLCPAPLASHDNIIRDRTLFFNTLRSFHSSISSKFQIPVIGGKELNLHTLYVEVTARGGYDKVVREKKWREIGSVFDFTPTTTSASYALRKHYFTLLYRYELVYFFRIRGSAFDLTGPTSYDIIGSIEGKFDSGYLVTVKLGDETLNGVLYHPASPSPSPTTTAIVPYTRRARRRRAEPGRPKPNRSAYNFFFAAKHALLKSQFPTREREFTKMIGEAWNHLSQDDRVVYRELGAKDKERYRKEMEEYRKKIGRKMC